MQPQPIVLEEIIYEITGKCKNRCNYCGSSDVWDSQIDEGKIEKIIDLIAEYPPRVINISGGDPLEVSLGTHRYLAEKLTCVRHIIINPKSIKHAGEYTVQHILEHYNWIGLSVNTYEELEAAQVIIDNYTNKVTLITNFNLLNAFLFSGIKDVLNRSDATKFIPWQIQYTMFFNDDDERAMYRDARSVEYLRKAIIEALQQGMNIILADNLNSGPCGAGMRSVGILENGDVIPCLSMRSWCKMDDSLIQGNLFEESLQVIWEDKFQDYRFHEFKCCKDACNAPLNIKDEDLIIPDKEKTFAELGKELMDGFRSPDTIQPKRGPIWDKTLVYGVGRTNVMAYAVFDVNCQCKSE